jgi:hypothetical protein
MTEETPLFIFTDAFLINLGKFYTTWLVLEATIDYTIGRFLKLPHNETHILTAGMEFGRKASLLRVLIDRSDIRNKLEIKQLLRKIQEESKRNIFAHSIIASNPTSVSFFYRKMDGTFSITEHSFTHAEFESHVRKMTSFAHNFSNALNVDMNEFQEFSRAALSASKSASKSPQPPSSSA